MTEKLIKRFLLEKAYETGVNIPTFGEFHYEDVMYEKLKKGEIKINELELVSWLKNLKRNKRSFGAYLKAAGYLQNDMKITEITDEEEVSSINSICLRADKTIIPSQAGEGCFERPYTKDINGHLLINGIYDNQLIYLSNLLKNSSNSFTIGYYGQGESEYAKKVLEYYKQLRKFLPLMTDKQKIDVIEDTVFNRDKVYVLTYHTNPIIHEVAPVITRYSER